MVLLMKFKEKLDFIMTLTKTSNSRLAKYASLDNSYISRLRNGNRSLPKKESFTAIFAAYFASHLRTDQAKAMLCQVIPIDFSDIPGSEADLSKLIHSWLTDGKKDTMDLVNIYIHKLKTKEKINYQETKGIEIRAGYYHEIESYIGPEGNSDAIINFLKIATMTKSPSKLFIFEDNNNVLFYKPNFKSKYFGLLMSLVDLHYEISVVFNINKPAEETLPIISSWLPLLLTGAVKAYYYPRYRDQLFNHHMLVIPEKMALMRTNFQRANDCSVTNIYTDKIVVASFTKEFSTFINYCHLLSTVVDSTSHKGYLDPLFWYDTQMEDSIIKTPCLTSMTMPLILVNQIFKSVEHKDKKACMQFHQQRAPKFKDYLSQCNYTEIIGLPTIETVLSGKILISYPDTFGIKERYYTPIEFCQHLRNVIFLLKQFPKYNIYLAPSQQSDDISIEVRENTGVIFAKYSKTTVYFLIMEPTTTNIFNDYLHEIIHYLPTKNKDKKEVLMVLESMLDQIYKKIS